MKKVIRTILILLVVFLAGVIFFSIQINRQPEKTADAEENPELPVGFMQVDGVQVNEMFGVKEELRETELRESLTPLPADRSLTFVIQTNGSKINGVSYQVTEPEGESLVENGDISNLKTADGSVTASFNLQGNIRSGQEYTLRFAVDIGEKNPVYYYTRLVQGGGVDLSDYFSFAQNFSQMCLDKNQSENLSLYLESDDTASNRSFTDVDIHSSADLVSWGNLNPEAATQAVPRIREVNDTTASIELDYIIQAQDSNEETEYYFVKDFFRMGHLSNGKDVSLLNFNRTAVLIFNGAHEVQTDTGLDLGVQDRSRVKVENSPDAGIAAFVVNGDLWSYNQNNGEMTRIFSFRGKNPANSLDDRTELTQHDISIENVSNDGDVTFVVYGYMAAGSHEGHMGVSVCIYSAGSNTTTEKLFIPLAQGYDCLSKNISKLSYVTADQNLYLFLGTELCRINLNDGSYTVVQDAIDADGFVVSQSQQTAAWVDDGNAGTAAKATIMDFENGRTSEVDAPSGEGLLACGFMNEDFVYGLVKPDDILQDANEQPVCGMNQLVIQDSKGEVKKEYTKENQYVTGITQESGGLALQLSTRNGNTFRDAGTDHIMNNEKQDEMVTLRAQVYERTGEKIMLDFPNTASSPDIRYRVPMTFTPDTTVETILEWPDATPENYYVYGEGRPAETFSQVNLAVQEADSLSGVVLNREQQYIWVRGDWGTSYTIDNSTLPSGVLSADMDAKALGDLLGDYYTVMDLTGVTQEDLKYFLAKGNPVLAQGQGTVYCILGYDAYNIWVYDPETRAPKAIASDDSEAEFEKNGNRFLTYMKN